MLIHSKQIEDTFDFRQGQYYVRLNIYLCTWSAWRYCTLKVWRHWPEITAHIP